MNSKIEIYKWFRWKRKERYDLKKKQGGGGRRIRKNKKKGKWKGGGGRGGGEEEEETLRKLLNFIRKSNIWITSIAEKEEWEVTKNLFKEIIAEVFSNPDMQIHITNRTPNYFNAKRPSPRHILLKWSKVNDKKIFKGSQITYKGILIRLSADFSEEILQARRERNDILKILKDKEPPAKNIPPNRVILYLWKRNKIFLWPKQRELAKTKLTLWEILKEALLPKTN